AGHDRVPHEPAGRDDDAADEGERGGPTGIGGVCDEYVALRELADLVHALADAGATGDRARASGNAAEPSAVVRELVVVEGPPALDVLGRRLLRVFLVDPAPRPDSNRDVARTQLALVREQHLFLPQEDDVLLVRHQAATHELPSDRHEELARDRV